MVNLWDFSEMCKAPVFSSSTFGVFGFLENLFYKVWNPCGIFVWLCSSHRYKPRGGNLVPFGPPSHRERSDVAVSRSGRPERAISKPNLPFTVPSVPNLADTVPLVLPCTSSKETLSPPLLIIPPTL